MGASGARHHYIRDKVPSGFRDPVSTQHVRTGMIFGTTLKNSSTVDNKHPANEILLCGHGRLIHHNKNVIITEVGWVPTTPRTWYSHHPVVVIENGRESDDEVTREKIDPMRTKLPTI